MAGRLLALWPRLETTGPHGSVVFAGMKDLKDWTTVYSYKPCVDCMLFHVCCPERPGFFPMDGACLPLKVFKHPVLRGQGHSMLLLSGVRDLRGHWKGAPAMSGCLSTASRKSNLNLRRFTVNRVCILLKREDKYHHCCPSMYCLITRMQLYDGQSRLSR